MKRVRIAQTMFVGLGIALLVGVILGQSYFDRVESAVPSGILVRHQNYRNLAGESFTIALPSSGKMEIKVIWLDRWDKRTLGDLAEESSIPIELDAFQKGGFEGFTYADRGRGYSAGKGKHYFVSTQYFDSILKRRDGKTSSNSEVRTIAKETTLGLLSLYESGKYLDESLNMPVSVRR